MPFLGMKTEDGAHSDVFHTILHPVLKLAHGQSKTCKNWKKAEPAYICNTPALLAGTRKRGKRQVRDSLADD